MPGTSSYRISFSIETGFYSFVFRRAALITTAVLVAQNDCLLLKVTCRKDEIKCTDGGQEYCHYGNQCPVIPQIAFIVICFLHTFGSHVTRFHQFVFVKNDDQN